MKRLRLILVLPLLTLAQEAPQQKPPQATVSGVVVTETGTPLPGATVILGGDMNTARLPGVPLPMAHVSRAGENGTFSFPDVGPGAYILAAEHREYPQQGYGAPVGVPAFNGTPLVIRPNQDLSGLRMVLTSQGVISGRLRDASGEPVQGVMVYAVRWSHAAGVRKLEQAGIENSTDGEGRFRIAGLPPGRHFVYAQPRRNQEDLSLAGPGVALATFAPNSLDVSGAVAVEVFAGGESTADIRLRQDGTFTVRGKVTGPGGTAAAGAVVLLLDGPDTPRLGRAGANLAINRAGGMRTPFAARLRADSEGNFVLRGVPPGSHRLFVTGGKHLSFGGPLYTFGPVNTPGTGGSALVEFTVRDQDVDDIAARLIPGAEATVQVHFEQNPGSSVNAPRWELVPMQGVSLGGSSNFPQPHELSPGQYSVEIVPPLDYYVKSVRLGGRDITGKELVVAGGTVGLNVLLARSTSRMAGSVTDGEGRPISGATVSIWPVTPDLSRKDGGAITGTSASDGSFSSRIAPGEYYVAAFEGLPDRNLGKYHGFYSLFASRAERVKVAVDGAATANLKVIPKSDVDRVIATLP